MYVLGILVVSIYKKIAKVKASLNYESVFFNRPKTNQSISPGNSHT